MMFKAILFACFLLTYSVSAESETETETTDNDDPPTVTLSYGTIQGIRDTNATMFLGIPFAEPPVKDLRWKDPIDVKPWKPSIYYATDFRPACAQSICGPASICPNITSEDCLYLNIYVPLNASATDLKAVMVYIHGGNFQWMSGSSPLFDGRYFARQEDVVIVTINYRLGSLGFLVTGTDKNQLHGNYGILDQKMAVKWIKNNIEAFFGDPERITLFGQSAGAQSIAAHLLSTDMQPYFNNAIVQSSPFAIPFRGFDEAMTIYYYFAEYLNCTLRDIDCLMSKSTEDIITAQMKTEVDLTSLKFLVFFEPWLPYLDGKTIKGQLLEFEKWELPSDFKFKPMIVGTLTGECYNYIYGAFQKPITTKMLVGIAFAAFKQHTLDVAEMYPPDITNPDQRELMVKACTSWVFACGSRNFLEKAQFWYPRDLTIGYQYIFDYPLDFPGWDNGTDYCYNYTCHGSDCPYTFDVPDANFTADGRYIAQTHMKYWSNFAKYNTTQSAKGIEWPSYDPKSRQYLRFQKPQNALEAHYREKECNMFDKIGYYY